MAIGDEALDSAEIKASIFVRSPYNYDKDFVSEETGLFCDDESLTDQSMAEDADINTIVRRFGITGQLPNGVRAPQFGDFTSISDFRTAVEAVQAAQDAFMEFPAEVRARFDNDPQLFLEFCSDSRNLSEMRKLGLAVPQVPSTSGADPAPAPAGA